MSKKITEIEGIGEATAARLIDMGIKTVEAFLKKGADPKGRDAIAKESGLSAAKVLAFVNMADLFRVKGIGSEYAELLQASGVNTVVELSKRNPENLHAKMLEVNADKKLVRQPPSSDTVAGWVQSAKELPRVVQY